MKTRLVLISTLFFAGILFSTSGFSQADCKNKHEGQTKGACMMADLTPAQQQKIQAIKLESDKKVLVYKADLKIKKAELDKLMIAETPSKKEIDSKIDELSVLKANVQKEKVGCQLLVRAELTPEQRIKFDAHHANNSDEMGSKECGSKMGSEGCKGHMENQGGGQMNHEGCKGHQDKENK